MIYHYSALLVSSFTKRCKRPLTAHCSNGLLCLFLTLLITCLAHDGFAIDKTWTGATSTNWGTGTNWSPSGVPTSSDLVYINELPTTNNPIISNVTTANVHALFISNTKSLVINSGGTLNSLGVNGISIYLYGTGSLTNSGTIRVEGSTGAGPIALYHNSMVTNNGTIYSDTPNGNVIVGDNATFINSSSGVMTLLGIGVAIRTVSAGNRTITNQGTINHTGSGYLFYSVSAETTGNTNFTNSGTITSESAAGVLYQTNVTFVNQACGKFFSNLGSFDQSAGTITNSGAMRIAGTLARSGGTFTNSGILNYGSLSGTITNSNGSVLVNTNPTNSTIFTYTGTFTGTVNGIFTNSAATTSAGTFTAPNTFSPSGLPTGSQTLYAKITPSGGACSYIVPFNYTYVSPPSITTQPVNRTVCTGNGTTFSVAASNASSYQWQVNTGGGFTNLSNTAPYSGVTGQTLTISNVAGFNGYQYRCVVTGAGGNTNSNGATLTVSSLPTVVILTPASTTLTCTTPTLTLTATGGGSYRWDNTTTTATRMVSASGTYSVTVTNASNCTAVSSQLVQSATATITTTNPSTNTAVIGVGFSQTFTSTSTRTASRTFALASGTLPTGLNIASTGILSGTPTQSGTFTVVVRATDVNGCTALGPNYVLTVNNLTPTIAGFAATSASVCVGSPATFTATVGNVTTPYNFTLSNGSSTTTGTKTSTAFRGCLKFHEKRNRSGNFGC